MTKRWAKAWVVVGILIAVVGFLFVDYRPSAGLVYNLTHGVVGFGRGYEIPLKFVLAVALAIVAFGVWNLWIGSEEAKESVSRVAGDKLPDESQPLRRQIWIAVAFSIGLCLLGVLLAIQTGRFSTVSLIAMTAAAVALIWFIISLTRLAIRAADSELEGCGQEAATSLQLPMLDQGTAMANAMRAFGRLAAIGLMVVALLVAGGMRLNPNSVDQLAGIALHAVGVSILFLLLHYGRRGLPTPSPRSPAALGAAYIVVGGISAAAFGLSAYFGGTSLVITIAPALWIALVLSPALVITGVGLRIDAIWAPYAANVVAFPLSLAWPIGLFLAVCTWWALGTARLAERKPAASDMKTLKLAGWLIIVTTVCIVGLIKFGVLGIPTSFVAAAKIFGAWVLLFVVAVIIAATASIGPKARATPVLTPVMAATVVVLVSCLVYVVGFGVTKSGILGVPAPPPGFTEPVGTIPPPPPGFTEWLPPPGFTESLGDQQGSAVPPPPGFELITPGSVTIAADLSDFATEVTEPPAGYEPDLSEFATPVPPVPYRPEGCDMTVRFPSEPNVKELEASGFRYEIAEWRGGVTFLRAECSPVAGPLSRGTLVEALKQRAVSDGLREAVVTINDPGADYLALRGYKTIKNVPATYVVRVYRGRRSVLAVMAASPSPDFPTNEIESFWRSIDGMQPIEP